MNHRYTVCDGDQPFASVHAATPDEAIASACMKVSGHDPQNCTATTDQRNHGNRWLTLGEWTDFDWATFGG